MLLTMLLAASSGFAGPGSRAPALARRTRFCTATAAKSHEGWMQYALQLAERGRFSTAPNPWHACECSNRSLPIMYSHAVARRARLLRVGCVIVAADGIEVLAEGFHKQKGGLHAEAAALAEAKARGVSREQMSEATCYVTLEPCHRGPGKTTPPCDEALVASGLRRIHISASRSPWDSSDNGHGRRSGGHLAPALPAPAPHQAAVGRPQGRLDVDCL